VNLDRNTDGPGFAKVVDILAAHDKSRADFLRACLAKLGLQVNQETTTVPSLSCLHLSSLNPVDTRRTVLSLQEIITEDEGKEYLKDENDTFLVQKPGVWSMHEFRETLPDDSGNKADQSNSRDRIIDYDSVVKRLVIHDEVPSSRVTPCFNHHAFYANLENYRSRSKQVLSQFGSQLLYGEVVTSTNTILEKYFRHLMMPTKLTSNEILETLNSFAGSQTVSLRQPRYNSRAEVEAPIYGFRQLARWYFQP
jgi:biotin---protein ligase